MPLIFTAFTMATPGHLLPGTWRMAGDRQADVLSASYWRELANIVDSAPFHALVIADSVGFQSASPAAQAQDLAAGRQVPVADALVITALLLTCTRHVGVIPTVSVIQDHPFTLARRLSTLDHLSCGRVGWNVVANSLTNAAQNFGQPSLPPRPERYALADDVVTVCRRLWSESWEADAVVRDAEHGVYADARRVHPVDTSDTRFQVAGPHLLPRSPQVEPLIAQAGASPVGRDFAARNADLWLFGAPSPRGAAALLADMHARLERGGRPADALRALQSVMPVTAPTESAARARAAEIDESVTDAALVGLLQGILQAPLDDRDLDRTIGDLVDAGLRAPENVIRSLAGRDGVASPALREIALRVLRSDRVVGAPEQIVDHLGAWVGAGVDGFNIMLAGMPGSLTEFLDGVVPVLQARGLMRSTPGEGTLREQVMGSDHDDRPICR